MRDEAQPCELQHTQRSKNPFLKTRLQHQHCPSKYTIKHFPSPKMFFKPPQLSNHTHSYLIHYILIGCLRLGGGLNQPLPSTFKYPELTHFPIPLCESNKLAKTSGISHYQVHIFFTRIYCVLPQFWECSLNLESSFFYTKSHGQLATNFKYLIVNTLHIFLTFLFYKALFYLLFYLYHVFFYRPFSYPYIRQDFTNILF